MILKYQKFPQILVLSNDEMLGVNSERNCL